MNRRLPHIDALKGAAILLVLLYHLDRTHFSTGYLGVELFFAVSGYFLLKDYATCNDTAAEGLGAFLRKKCARLYAPLIPMLLAALPLAAGLCYYGDTLITAETGLCSLLGVANVYLNHCVGDYFSIEAMQNPLVHLWFLSVLMQGLLLFWVLMRLTRGLLRRVWMRRALLAAVAVASFLAGHVAWGDGEPVGYYATFPRLWEFAAGGLAAALPCIPGRKGMLAAGAAGALLLLSLVPDALGGLSDLAAVAAACVLIRTGAALPTVGVVSGALSGLGRASYSIYLWHLPLIYFYKHVVEKQPYSWDRALLIPLSLLLGYALYRLVERRRWKGALLAPCWALALILYSAAVFTRGGADFLHHQAYQVAVPSDTYSRTACRAANLLRDFPTADLHNWREVGFAHDSLWKALSGGGTAESDLYALGDAEGTPEFLLMGDSHAGALSYGFDSVGRDAGWCGVYLSAYVVPVWADCEREYRLRQAVPYAQSRKGLLRWLKAHPEIHTVVVAQNWSLRMEYAPGMFQAPPEMLPQCLHDAIVEYFRRLKETGKQIIIMSDLPQFHGFSLSGIYCSIILGRPLPPAQIERDMAEHARGTAYFNNLFQELQRLGYCDAVLHQAPALEDGGTYKAIINHRVLMKDSNHLNDAGADRVVRRVKDTVDTLLKAGRERTPAR